MKTPAVAIFTAVRLEAEAVAAALLMSSPSPALPVSGAFDGVPISLHLIGISAANLRNITFKYNPEYLVMAGVAGALDPALAIGDVLVQDCPSELAEACGFRRGIIHSATALVSTPAQKSELFNSLGAAAVDMETATVRNWAAQRNIPFIALRAISDSAFQQLDPALLSLVDAWGNPRPVKVLQFLAANPLRARSLIQLGRDSKFAANQLGQAIVTLMRRIARTRLVP